MTPPPNLLTAVKQYLITDASVGALVGTKVYGQELPQSQIPNMPEQCIVIRRAGGHSMNTAYMELGDLRFDIHCYGQTPMIADVLSDTVHITLRSMERCIRAATLIHWARPAGGPISMRAEDTEWPVTLSIWQVLGSERGL